MLATAVALKRFQTVARDDGQVTKAGCRMQARQPPPGGCLNRPEPAAAEA